MDAFGVLEKVLGDYQSFVSGFLNIRDRGRQAQGRDGDRERLAVAGAVARAESGFRVRWFGV